MVSRQTHVCDNIWYGSSFLDRLPCQLVSQTRTACGQPSSPSIWTHTHVVQGNRTLGMLNGLAIIPRPWPEAREHIHSEANTEASARAPTVHLTHSYLPTLVMCLTVTHGEFTGWFADENLLESNDYYLHRWYFPTHFTYNIQRTLVNMNTVKKYLNSFDIITISAKTTTVKVKFLLVWIIFGI